MEPFPTVSIVPTIPVSGGALVVNEQDTLSLASVSDSLLLGELTIETPGTYRVVLESELGRDVAASPDFFIDVLDDMPPSVTFTTPGRDLQVTMVDEVFVEVRAEDDFALGSVDLVYAVNGGPEQTQKDGASTLFHGVFSLGPAYRHTRNPRSARGSS